ncbi:outer membrane protein OmpA-like peptidoglycan-associated protein [Longimicrobium terrae]|uniref:Outer membrane protein OmpA-like peptidoglycan-associated protein n=2 Tax=Longimicrobium terrae TaxID=1639882 RepID=A0A841H7G3_9BACT|nr:outer membrane protein OmpA-like peptidoglycan-associated protein [Longimicrobium terrae]MBB6073786.1 outer membrane protein OmpA-like peptidoglycan-associated protein [Longimicrobium terrae]NNC30279.1 OmpA family protein [Longimicrobium terrae]
MKRSIAAALCVATFGTTACASLNNTERGAGIGAGAGGAIGAVIGRQTGNTARGAIIGAVVGGAAGAVIGRRMDRQAQELETIPNTEVQRVGEGIAVTFESGILFATNSDVIQSAGQSNLRQLAASLQRYPGTEVLIVGHTDADGSDDYNMGLSLRRASAARNYLVGQGISSSVIRVEGRGESEPVADNTTAAGKSRNRRVEVAIFASEEYRQQVLRENGSQ